MIVNSGTLKRWLIQQGIMNATEYDVCSHCKLMCRMWGEVVPPPPSFPRLTYTQKRDVSKKVNKARYLINKIVTIDYKDDTFCQIKDSTVQELGSKIKSKAISASVLNSDKSAIQQDFKRNIFEHYKIRSRLPQQQEQ